LNSGLCACKAEALYHLSYTSRPVLHWLFWRWGVSWTISLEWSWTITLPIPVSFYL
jgi:hypothetical protein